MIGIIVVFPKKENAINIRNLLVRGGYSVTGVGTTGAQAVQFAEAQDEGIVICGYKMKDMLYSDIREYLPDNFEVLVIASRDKWQGELPEGVIGLPMPIKVYDLMDTIEMLMQTLQRKRKKRRMELKNRNPEQQEIIKKAKLLLMEKNNMSEAEAHRYLQKNSMDSGTNMVETAQMVLSIMRD